MIPFSPPTLASVEIVESLDGRGRSLIGTLSLFLFCFVPCIKLFLLEQLVVHCLLARCC
jgi:hypothetical protein